MKHLTSSGLDLEQGVTGILARRSPIPGLKASSSTNLLAQKKRHGLRRALRREVDLYNPGLFPFSTTRVFSTLKTPLT